MNLIKLGDKVNERKLVTKSVTLEIMSLWILFFVLPLEGVHMCFGKQILSISVTLDFDVWLAGACFAG